MTIREYISDKLRAFGITEAQLVDMSLSAGFMLDEEVSEYAPNIVGMALTQTLEECILAPKQTSVSEQGFSMSWDFSTAGKYYLWLCRKWGLTPDGDVLDALGLSTITDRSDIW